MKATAIILLLCTIVSSVQASLATVEHADAQTQTQIAAATPSYTPEINEKALSPGVVAAVILGPSFCIIIGLISCYVCVKRWHERRKERKERLEQEQAVGLGLGGDGVELGSVGGSVTTREHVNEFF